MPFRDLVETYETDQIQTLTEAYKLAVTELGADDFVASKVAKIILKHFTGDPMIGSTALAEISVKEIRFGFE